MLDKVGAPTAAIPARTRKPQNYVVVVRNQYGEVKAVQVNASKKDAEDYIAGLSENEVVDCVIKGEIITPRKIVKL